jgi:hypothetical protein
VITRFALASLVLLSLAAQADDFIFAPAYVLPSGATAALGVLTRATASTRFINPNGQTGMAQTYNLSEFISVRRGLTDADQLTLGVSYSSHNERKNFYDYGNIVAVQGARKAQPAVTYTHRFGGRHDAFTAAASIGMAQANQGTGTSYTQPGLALQYRVGEQFLLKASSSLSIASSSLYASLERYQEGVEWQALPWLDLAPQFSQIHSGSVPGSTGMLEKDMSLIVRAQLDTAFYLTMEAGASSQDAYRQKNWQYSSQDGGHFSRIGFYLGF